MLTRGRRASAGSYVGPITITSITADPSGTTATINFTHQNPGKASLIYRGSQGVTFGNYVSSSPATVSVSPGAAYTFTMTAASGAGQINSATTNSSPITITEQSYTLSQTFLSSGTFTVPAGKTQIAVKGIGAGGNGANGNNSDGGSGATGGRGGGGGGGFIFKNYSVTPGQTFSVTIGSSGQATSFGTLATANSGTSSGGGGFSSTIGLEANSSGPTGGAGGSGGSYSYSFGSASPGQQGSGGSGGTTLSSSAPGVGTITLGGSGGGGGGGAVGSTNGPASGGSGGSSSGGSGSGGSGGSGAQPGSGGGTSAGQSGNAASSRGAGGGGGGGGALSRDSGTGGGIATSGGTGGAGQPGAIYVYVR